MPGHLEKWFLLRMGSRSQHRGTSMKAHPRARGATVLGLIVVISLISWRSRGGSLPLFEPIKPPPDLANVRYGPYDRNVLDLWQAKPKPVGSVRAPLLVFFHGGGFRNGDKSSVPARLVLKCLDAGISVASANYRLSTQAPFPAPMLDGARVIQFVRFKAKELGIDAARIATSGNSAGAGIALWVGFHDDLADPQSADEIGRQPSRVACVGVEGAQTSYDPRLIKETIGGRAHEHPALRAFYGITSDDELDSPRAHRLYQEASPINYVSADDPPSILFYAEPNAPLPLDAKPGLGIHHPRFGAALKARLDPLGVECVLHHRDEYVGEGDPNEGMFRDMVAFLTQHFRGR
jgi:acetyl esterase/lipase